MKRTIKEEAMSIAKNFELSGEKITSISPVQSGSAMPDCNACFFVYTTRATVIRNCSSVKRANGVIKLLKENKSLWKL